MPRPIWRGAISFGLVTIPVGLHSATEEKRPKFNQLRKSDGSRIRYRKVAEADGTEVASDEIVKGYEIDKGRYVVFTDDELQAALRSGTAGAVDVVQFVKGEEIDPIYYQKSYYLTPEKTGAKAYRILVDALHHKGMVGLARMAMRGREYPATLRTDGEVLVLETMFWPDEIREPVVEEEAAEVAIRPDEVKMAEMIIDNLTAPFDPTEWVDASRAAVEELARRKAEGEEIVAPEAPRPTGVVDLMEALKASVEATKERRRAG